MKSFADVSINTCDKIIGAGAKSYNDTLKTVLISSSNKEKHVKRIIIIIFYVLFFHIVIRNCYYLFSLHKALVKTSVKTKTIIILKI